MQTIVMSNKNKNKNEEIEILKNIHDEMKQININKKSFSLFMEKKSKKKVKK